MAGFERITTAELAAKYDRANLETRHRIGCGMSCPTCLYCVHGNDIAKQEDWLKAFFCTISERSNT